jgi:hypothetical protein
MLEQGDVIIFNVPAAGSVVADALSRQPLEGPFPAFTDALVAARRLAITGTIWRQRVDEHGRSMGHPIPIPEFRVLVFSKDGRFAGRCGQTPVEPEQEVSTD